MTLKSLAVAFSVISLGVSSNLYSASNAELEERLEKAEKQIKKLKKHQKKMKDKDWAIIEKIDKMAEKLKINGFMSAGMTKLNKGGGVVYENGIDQRTRTAPDAIVGLQLKMELSDKASMTTQLTAKGVDNYEVQTSWAYLTYDFTKNYSVSIGQMRVPNYMYTKSVDIGFTYPWVRPPNEVYFQGGGGFYTGISNRFRFSYGGIDFDASLNFGNQDLETATLAGPLENLVSVGVDAFKNGWTFHLGHMQGQLSLEASDNALLTNHGIVDIIKDLDRLRDETTIPETNGITGMISYTDTARISYDSIGLKYESGPWYAIGEYVKFDGDKMLYDPFESFYVSFGYKINKFMPYVVASAVNALGDNEEHQRQVAEAFETMILSEQGATINQALMDMGIAQATMDLAALAEAQAIYFGAKAQSLLGYATFVDPKTEARYLDEFFGTNTTPLNNNQQHQVTYTLGVRYDLTDTIATKFEVSQVGDLDGSGGMFNAGSAPGSDTDHVNMMTFVVDAVF